MDEKDKDNKEKDQEDDMLTTRNDPEEPKVDTEPDAPEMPDEPQPEKGSGAVDTEYLMELIAAKDDLVVVLQDRVAKLEKSEKKKKASDAGNLAGAIKAMAGLTMSPDGLSAFKQMVPYIFEE